MLKKSPQYCEHKGGLGGRFEQVMGGTLQIPHIEEQLFPVAEGVVMDRDHWDRCTEDLSDSAPPPSQWRAGQGRVFCKRHFLH